MTVRLQQGGNLLLSPYVAPDQPVQIGVGWQANGNQALDIDVSAFLVTSAGRVRGDDDFVFYNQPSTPDGSVQWAKAPAGSEDSWLITILPARVPPDVAKVVIAATIHEGVERRQSFDQLRSAYGHLVAGGQEQIRYDVQVAGMPETALLLMELYRHSSGWKLRAIGQGFVGGLGPLAQSMGVAIESDAAEASPVSDGLTMPAGVAPAGIQSSSGGRARSIAGSGTPPPAAPGPARTGPSQSQQSGNRCSRCDRPFGLLDRISGNRGLCGRCRNEVAEAMRRFRLAFLAASSNNYVTDAEWQGLLAQAQAAGVELSAALEFIRADALHSLERLLTFHFADGILSPEEEQDVRNLKARYQIPDSAFRSLEERITRLKFLTAIREGNLPTVQLPRGMHLETDEICHLHARTSYVKVTARGEQLVPGEIVATNRKMLFTSPTGGTEIKWKAVVRIEQQPYSVYLELSKKGGTGHYRVDDPEQVTAVLDTLVRIANRQLVGASVVATRHIPQPVKIAVWQRDGGKCVECGAEQYLEFDHIIPYSRGGASTEGNVQLLCRACNLRKGDRI